MPGLRQPGWIALAELLMEGQIMPKLLKRRGLLLAGVITVIAAGSAFAYWTAGGSGTGSAPVAGASTTLTANQTGTLNPMFPGDSAQTISGTFTNPNAGPIYVTSVTVSIASVSAPGCDASDFTITGATMPVGREVVTGGVFTGATIQFNNKAGSNQDACKSATVNLAYAIA